jgi:valyl-tRNA synthetase
VKARRYGDFTPEKAASANSAMLVALKTLLRLFAPFLPFVTEEVWSWWRPGSIHRAAWPEARDLEALAAPDTADARALDLAIEILAAIRRKKSEDQRPLKTAVTRLSLVLPEPELPLFEAVRDDVAGAGYVRHIETASGGTRRIDMELAAAEAEPAVREPHA